MRASVTASLTTPRIDGGPVVAASERATRNHLSMALSDEVRAHCAAIAASARSVTIDRDALEAYEAAPEARIDPELHRLDGDPESVARALLTLDAINFGSGWFPTLRKDPGRSGYATIASALARAPRAVEQRRAARAHAPRTSRACCARRPTTS